MGDDGVKETKKRRGRALLLAGLGAATVHFGCEKKPHKEPVGNLRPVEVGDAGPRASAPPPDADLPPEMHTDAAVAQPDAALPEPRPVGNLRPVQLPKKPPPKPKPPVGNLRLPD